MKYIGIVSRVEEVDGYETAFTGIPEYYRNALLNYEEVMPILILPPKKIFYGKVSSFDEMNEENKENQRLNPLLELCDGFLVPGGSKWFSYDEYIVEYALKHDKPLLGICLGMQIMGIVDNKLNSGIFDKTSRLDTSCNHRESNKKYSHKIIIEKDSYLHKILKVDECKVNSMHSYCIQGVVDFKVSAYSTDGVIEAIEHPLKTFAIGVQWHPEKMIEYDEVMKKIFDEFIFQVQNQKANRKIENVNL